jgi:hypothetical protein
MALYYLDPESEPRECQYCCDPIWKMPRHEYNSLDCPNSCGGSGRLGVAGAFEDVNVFRWGGTGDALQGHYWAPWPPVESPITGETVAAHGPYGPFPTEAAALTAARKAYRERK